MVKTDKIIFYASLAALVFFVAPIFVWSQDSYQALLALKVYLENTFGSTYQILTFAVLIFVLWLAFSKHGEIKLGDGDYHFDTFSWASMIFCLVWLLVFYTGERLNGPIIMNLHLLV